MRESARDDGRGLGAAGAVLLCALALAGCADSLAGMSLPSLPKLDDINPFAEKPVPLPGKRISVIQQENVSHQPRRCRQADRFAAAAAERLLDPARRRGQQRARSLGTRWCCQERLERQRRQGLELFRQADRQPHRLRRQGVHAGRGGQDFGLQCVRRIGGLAGLGNAAQREGQGRVRRRPCRGRRPHLCRNGLWLRGRARRQDRRQAVGEVRRLAGAHLADGRGRARVRPHQGGAGLLPVRLRRHRALAVPRHGRARQPAFQYQPCRRRRCGGGALPERRPRGLARLRWPGDLDGVAGAHAHGLVDGGDERHGAAGDRRRHGLSRSAMPAAWWPPSRGRASDCGR